MKRSVFAAIAGALLLSLPLPTGGLEAQSESFDTYVEVLRSKARAEGVSEATINRMTRDLTPNMRVIELDQQQPGTPSRPGVFPPVSAYLDRHVEPARIRNGQSVYNSSGSLRADVETRYGVPSEILIAIWGHETAYGSVRGNFDLARALATLAWEGRRRALFESEFLALMKVADKGYSRDELVGSWAGAFGNPQFLPSVYLRLATDGDGDGKANIFTNRADTLASIANYLKDAGWEASEPWGVRASVPAGFDWNAVATEVVAPVCPRVHDRHSRWMSVAEWQQMGVRPQSRIGSDTLAMLFQPDGPGTPAWLLTGNYRAILEYNCSNYYALSVGELADRIAN